MRESRCNVKQSKMDGSCGSKSKEGGIALERRVTREEAFALDNGFTLR